MILPATRTTTLRRFASDCQVSSTGDIAINASTSTPATFSLLTTAVYYIWQYHDTFDSVDSILDFPRTRTYLFELVVVEDHSFLDPTVVRVRAFRVVMPPRRDSSSLGGNRPETIQGLTRLFGYPGVLQTLRRILRQVDINISQS